MDDPHPLQWEILKSVSILLRMAGFPDQHQVFDDLAKRKSTAKQKDPRDMTTSFKMVP
jgi:hypothetical protein